MGNLDYAAAKQPDHTVVVGADCNLAVEAGCKEPLEAGCKVAVEADCNLAVEAGCKVQVEPGCNLAAQVLTEGNAALVGRTWSTCGYWSTRTFGELLVET